MTPNFSRFAARTLAAFIVGSVFVMFLEVAERQELIAKLTESALRLAVWSVLVVVLLYYSRAVSASARLAFQFCTLSLLFDLSLDVIEDIEALNQLPIIGGESRWRHTIEKVAVSCWACGAFCLMYVLMRDLDSSLSAVKKQNSEINQLNSQLRSTIGDLQTVQGQIVQQERMAALGQMASGVAHDLNNALSPVLAFSEMAIDYPEQFNDIPDAHKCIYHGASHAANIVEQLQHFYRDDYSGSDKTKFQNISIYEVIQNAKELTSFRWSDEANKSGIPFEILLDDVGRDICVLGFRTELVQLLTNVIMNAIDAMDSGGTIRISAIERDGLVELTVSDQGMGMSADERKRCFEPFFSKKHSGTGLGLSVCHGIVRRHGGTIQCNANIAGGCDFVILLPSAVSSNEYISGADNVILGDGLRILVIDDDTLVRTSTAALLSSFGNLVDTAIDAETGCELAQKNAYDLVVTDMGMPGKTGRDVVAEIKQRQPQQQIALLSGWSQEAVRAEFKACEKPDFYISKPINAAKLRKVLEQIPATNQISH